MWTAMWAITAGALVVLPSFLALPAEVVRLCGLASIVAAGFLSVHARLSQFESKP